MTIIAGQTTQETRLYFSETSASFRPDITARIYVEDSFTLTGLWRETQKILLKPEYWLKCSGR